MKKENVLRLALLASLLWHLLFSFVFTLRPATTNEAVRTFGDISFFGALPSGASPVSDRSVPQKSTASAHAQDYGDVELSLIENPGNLTFVPSTSGLSGDVRLLKQRTFFVADLEKPLEKRNLLSPPRDTRNMGERKDSFIVFSPVDWEDEKRSPYPELRLSEKIRLPGEMAGDVTVSGPIASRGFLQDIPMLAKVSPLQESNVRLKFWVFPDGVVESFEVEKSSGNANLDSEAASLIKRWRFKGLPDDVPQKRQWGIARFRLKSKP